jgi:hypothetical protein
LVINEIMPDNGSTIEDESGDFDGWLELFNGGLLPINLTGLAISTDLSSQGRWELPAVMIRPGEHKLVWMDGQEAEGPLHAPLCMYARGDVIRLFAPAAAGGMEIDRQEYGEMQADRSMGRSRDGAADWIPQSSPTPGEPNSGLIPGPVPSAVVLRDNYPNPFNAGTNLIFGVPAYQRVRIQVYDARGRLVTTLVDDYRDKGYHPVQWNGKDAGGRAAASGVYFARLESGGATLTNTMTLVR